MKKFFIAERDCFICNQELFDSIEPLSSEIHTVSNSLRLFLKYSVKCLFLKRLYKPAENLKYKATSEQDIRGRFGGVSTVKPSGFR